MPDIAAEANSLSILHTLGLTPQSIRDHVLFPENVATATLHPDLITLHQPSEGTDDPVFTTPPSGLLYRLNVKELRDSIVAALGTCVIGYSMQLRRYGGIVWDRQYNWSKVPRDGGPAWTSDVPMHIASVSKLITAMAITRLLLDKNISPDEHIWPWLPPYWLRGPGVDGITFRQLLTHTSGLVALDEPGRSDYPFMKEQIALGVVGKPGYRNMNFGLCRILISTIGAPQLFNLIPSTDDNFWDATTIRYYAQYVGRIVFAPVGVTSDFLHDDPNALAYAFPDNGRSFNSGDLTTMSGCAAWHLAVNDLLPIMAAFRRLGWIVDPDNAQLMLERGFGLDRIWDNNLGRNYFKGGFWGTENGTFIEQSEVYFLPKGYELAILSNSPFCMPNTGFAGAVQTAIDNSVENILLSRAVALVSAFAVVLAIFTLGRRVVARRP